MMEKVEIVGDEMLVAVKRMVESAAVVESKDIVLSDQRVYGLVIETMEIVETVAVVALDGLLV